jgi:long-subunit acyl-CoA synthetase (AMP-forming)
MCGCWVFSSQIWVYGNSFESTLVAVAVPNEKVLVDWAAANGENGNFETLCNSQKAHEFILTEVNATGKSAGVSWDLQIPHLSAIIVNLNSSFNYTVLFVTK